MRSWKIVNALSESVRLKAAFVGPATFAVLVALTAFAADAPAPGTSVRAITDATGAKVEVLAHPQRIVTLAPSLGELAADLSGEDFSRIVGVSEYTDYPPVLTKIPAIGPYARFNLEKVVALHPDLVLATADGNSKDQIQRLRELKIPVVVVATESFGQVEQSIRLVADAMGEGRRGELVAEQLKTGLQRIRDKTALRLKKAPRRRVLLQIGDDPLITVGRKSFLHEALEIVGAENIYGDSEPHYPRVSREDAVHRDPDLILVLALGENLRPFWQMALAWKPYTTMKAVRTRQVRVLKDDAVLRPTLRLLEGLAILERAVLEGAAQAPAQAPSPAPSRQGEKP